MKLPRKFLTVPIEEVPSSSSPADGTTYLPLALVVDGDSSNADALAGMLIENGFAAVAAYDGPDALETAQIMPPELLIAGFELPGMTGAELANSVRNAIPDCKIVLFSEKETTSRLLARASETLKPRVGQSGASEG